MMKKAVVSIILIAVTATVVFAVLPLVQAQQYGAQQTEIERFQRELDQKLNMINSSLSQIQRTLDIIRSQVDRLERGNRKS